jgi:hypothetical protein
VDAVGPAEGGGAGFAVRCAPPLGVLAAADFFEPAALINSRIAPRTAAATPTIGCADGLMPLKTRSCMPIKGRMNEAIPITTKVAPHFRSLI